MIDFWQEHKAQLRGFIAKRIRESDAVDDVLQDVYLKAQTNLHTVKSHGSLIGWLYRIAANAIADHYRAQKSWVGDSGQVIGIDMTAEMISKARTNANTSGYRNVEFRLGEIENMPVADGTVDVIISNCVINLSPDKPRVFGEAYRVLKPGGRLAISDVVTFAELPEAVREDMALYTGCIAGASMVSEVEAMLKASGFADIRVAPKDESKSFIRDWAPGTDITEYVVSATIEAIKPA